MHCVSVAMPLWSNEEWRARIGSCWCALGRPFKTDKSSGDYQSCALSGRAMLQAVYVLMAMILVQGVKSINGCVNECQRQLKSKSNRQLQGHRKQILVGQASLPPPPPKYMYLFPTGIQIHVVVTMGN